MNHDKHGYGAMVSMSLPWLGGRRGDEIEQNERILRADAKALQSTRSAARFELFDSAARVEAAQQHFAILDRDLLPQARRRRTERLQRGPAFGRRAYWRCPR